MNEISDALHLVTRKLDVWLQQFVLMLPNLAIALVLLIVTFFAARLMRRAAENLLTRFSHSVALNNLVAALVQVTVTLIGLFFVLSILNLDKTVTSLLAGVGIIGLALGFAFQDIAANFISGVIIAVRKPFSVGDVIETNEHFGTIERVNMRTLDIRRQTGELVILPNRKVFENAVINYTHYGLRRIDLDVGVSYAEDLEHVTAVVLEAMQGIKGQVESKEVEVMFDEFDESSINFKVRFWVHYTRQLDFVQAKSEAIMKIKKAFDTRGIQIPFPIRTLDFGIKGGQTLAQQLGNIAPGKDQNPAAPAGIKEPEIPKVDHLPKPKHSEPLTEETPEE